MHYYALREAFIESPSLVLSMRSPERPCRAC
jgi:hypothetical protein